jgi:hypothetical protein
MRRMNSAVCFVGVLLAMFAVLAGDACAQGGVYMFQVPATSPWYDTGINLLGGWQLSITATGLATYDAFEIGGPLATNANGGDVSGQNFFSDAVLPSAEIHSLIGKIGGTTSVGSGTPVPGGLAGYGAGFVGESYSEQITTSGRLFLGYNDEVPDFYDNSGGVSVTVTVVPEPSTLGLLGLGVLLLLSGVKGRGNLGKTRDHSTGPA